MTPPSPTRPRAFTAQHLLLLLVVAAPLARHFGAGALPVFALSALAVVPLAGLMGEATESLAERLGAGVGGLLNATFGNAAELILAFVALRHGHVEIVKASLTGSILGNTLLVLGVAMLAGGARRERQTFDRAAATMSSTLLLLAAIALVVPAAFHIVAEGAEARGALTAAGQGTSEHNLSLFIAIVLFVAYLLSLLFSLRTHRHLYDGNPQRHVPATVPGAARAVITLMVATVLVAWMSELLVGAVEGASHVLGLTQVFVGVIVVAVVGNAAEHSTAVRVALRNKMDLALNIAVGSSIQIALFVAPLLVFASHLLPGRPMDLAFTPFEVLAVLAAAAIVNVVSADGESNWLEGVMLLAVYLVLGVAFYFLP
jgi:Ca2+:H+ antiporter